MTSSDEAAVGGSEQSAADIATPLANGQEPLSTRAAAQAVTRWRRKHQAGEAEPARAETPAEDTQPDSPPTPDTPDADGEGTADNPADGPADAASEAAVT